MFLLHLDFFQTSSRLQLLAKPELGTTPAPAPACFKQTNNYKIDYKKLWQHPNHNFFSYRRLIRLELICIGCVAFNETFSNWLNAWKSQAKHGLHINRNLNKERQLRTHSALTSFSPPCQFLFKKYSAHGIIHYTVNDV